VLSFASPSITPFRSLSVRFWLTFHLPSSRWIGNSKPTIPFNCDLMKSFGASLTFHGTGDPALFWAIRCNRYTICKSCKALYTLVISHLVDLASGDVVQLVRTLPCHRLPVRFYLRRG